MQRPQSNATSLLVPLLTKPADSGAAGFSFALAARGKLLTVPFKSMLFGAAGATGEAYFAAQCRSNLLWRSRGISLITKAPRLWLPKSLNARHRLKFRLNRRSKSPEGLIRRATQPSPPALAPIGRGLDSPQTSDAWAAFLESRGARKLGQLAGTNGAPANYRLTTGREPAHCVR